MKALIVDDEPFAIKGLVNYLKDINYIELVDTCESAKEALDVIQKQKIDLLFLDINMPGMTGIALLKTLKEKPITIITSAHSEFALEGFELDVLDYIVKPIGFERFLKACDKAHEFWNYNKMKTKNISVEDYIFIKCDKKIEKVLLDEILYVESLHNYVSIVSVQGRYITHATLKSVEEKLPKNKFLKIQKSFIVSIQKISKIENDKVYIKDKEINISRINREETLKIILGNNFIKK